MTHFHRMQWYESPEFARAKARAERSDSGALAVLIIALPFSIVLTIMDLPDNIADFAVIILLAVTVGSLITFVPRVFAQAPKNVSVDENKIVIGNDSTNLTDVDFVVVGKAMIGETEFPVFSIQTADGRSFVAGLSSRINPEELANAFEKLGLRVE